MRGNPVMKAKRVHGPTPNTVLCTHVVLERCECGDPNVVSTSTGGLIVRKCLPCLLGTKRVQSGIRPEVAAEMWWKKRQ